MHHENPAHFHPQDMERLGLSEAQKVQLNSHLGTITATARADATLRPGCVSLTHGWGGLDPKRAVGVNVNILTGRDEFTQTINFMPVLTAVPIVAEADA
jgi:anaerobic selenocysteine-containing dehydrogenase